jgi:hypothetical protein
MKQEKGKRSYNNHLERSLYRTSRSIHHSAVDKAAGNLNLLGYNS